MEYMTLTLHGDHLNMGRQHGHQVKHLRAQIAQAMEARLCQLERDGCDARFERLLQETLEVVREHEPRLLDLIRGQAEALEMEFDRLLRHDLVTYLRDDLLLRQADADQGCTTWAASGSATADGKPILAKNRDYDQHHLPLQAMVQATPDTGYRYLYVTSAGSPGIFCAGMNEAGLAVADTHVYSSDLGPGLPDYALMLHILERHDTVSSALDYMRSVPRLGRNNLILADARSHLAVFEGGHRGYGLAETHDGTLVNTNHLVSPEMRHHFAEIDPPHIRMSTFHRYEKARAELDTASGRIDVAFARELMASHDGPLASLCRHPGLESDTSTISTCIFLPAQQTLLFCQGLPCQGTFDEFGF
jgi:isopenicillin-N N-acyltransferase-like protein